MAPRIHPLQLLRFRHSEPGLDETSSGSSSRMSKQDCKINSMHMIWLGRRYSSERTITISSMHRTSLLHGFNIHYRFLGWTLSISVGVRIKSSPQTGFTSLTRLVSLRTLYKLRLPAALSLPRFYPCSPTAPDTRSSHPPRSQDVSAFSLFASVSVCVLAQDATSTTSATQLSSTCQAQKYVFTEITLATPSLEIIITEFPLASSIPA
ncbi:hypothetical protein BDW66DRAFT_67033 [Aspergillus desertorum]